MEAMRFLPTKVHGVLDYLVVAALIVAPWLFGLSSVGGSAVMLPILIGITLVVYSLLTKYEWGVVKVIPMSYHLIVDFLASAFLLVSPWLLGFYNSSNPKVWLPHVFVGAAVILVVLVSKTEPEEAE
jgi:hypothetical protein